MSERITTERARAMLTTATPGPWTHSRVGYGQHAVTPDARCEIFVEREHDAALIAAAPDLAADLIDARAWIADEPRRMAAAVAGETARCVAALKARREECYAAARRGQMREAWMIEGAAMSRAVDAVTPVKEGESDG